MSIPEYFDGTPPTVQGITIDYCEWTRLVRRTYRSVSTGWKWRGGAGIWKKAGPGSTYSYLPGAVTIDNRSSSSPTTVYWKIRHPGRAFGARYYWNSQYSTPGSHRGTWFALNSHTAGVKMTIGPYMMFTVTQLGVHYRVSRLVRGDRDRRRHGLRKLALKAKLIIGDRAVTRGEAD